MGKWFAQRAQRIAEGAETAHKDTIMMTTRKIMFRAMIAALALGGSVSNPSSANAAYIGRTYSFYATNFFPQYDNGPEPIPYDQVFGLIRIAFDDSVSTGQDENYDIFFFDLNIPHFEPASYLFYPQNDGGRFVFGGGGQDINVGLFPGTEDFSFRFSNVHSRQPIFEEFAYTAPNSLNYFVSTTGFVSDLQPIPEPATWALMIAGFGVVGAGMRRRRGSVRVTYA
jgi:PEP-CTERM motif